MDDKGLRGLAPEQHKPQRRGSTCVLWDIAGPASRRQNQPKIKSAAPVKQRSAHVYKCTQRNGFRYMACQCCLTASCAMTPRLLPNQFKRFAPQLAAECAVAVTLASAGQTLSSHAGLHFVRLESKLPDSYWSIVLYRLYDVMSMQCVDAGSLTTTTVIMRSMFHSVGETSSITSFRSGCTVRTTSSSITEDNKCRLESRYDGGFRRREKKFPLRRTKLNRIICTLTVRESRLFCSCNVTASSKPWVALGSNERVSEYWQGAQRPVPTVHFLDQRWPTARLPTLIRSLPARASCQLDMDPKNLQHFVDEPSIPIDEETRVSGHMEKSIGFPSTHGPWETMGARPLSDQSPGKSMQARRGSPDRPLLAHRCRGDPKVKPGALAPFQTKYQIPPLRGVSNNKPPLQTPPTITATLCSPVRMRSSGVFLATPLTLRPHLVR